MLDPEQLIDFERFLQKIQSFDEEAFPVSNDMVVRIAESISSVRIKNEKDFSEEDVIAAIAEYRKDMLKASLWQLVLSGKAEVDVNGDGSVNFSV